MCGEHFPESGRGDLGVGARFVVSHVSNIGRHGAPGEREKKKADPALTTPTLKKARGARALRMTASVIEFRTTPIMG